MSKFIKFYEWLCDAMVPLLIIGLLFCVAVVYKIIFAGQAITILDAIVGIVAITFDYIVVFIRAICALIYRFKMRREA